MYVVKEGREDPEKKTLHRARLTVDFLIIKDSININYICRLCDGNGPIYREEI